MFRGKYGEIHTSHLEKTTRAPRGDSSHLATRRESHWMNDNDNSLSLLPGLPG